MGSLEHRSSWNSILQLKYNTTAKQYTLHIGANQFGKTNIRSFENALQNYSQDFQTYNQRVSAKYWCEIFLDEDDDNNCEDFNWQVKRWAQSIRFLIDGNTTKSTSDFTEKLLNLWQPLCEKYPYSPCASGYQIHGDLPNIGQNGIGVHAVNDTPISEGFRKASFQVLNLGVNFEKGQLTFVQEEEWMHNNLGPALYPYTTSSYFNEAEYTYSPGQWERRFWGEEKHCRLEKIKEEYDPHGRFTCYHCVGDEVKINE